MWNDIVSARSVYFPPKQSLHNYAKIASGKSPIDAAGVFSINLMASPGAGKTSLIEQTLPRLADRLRVADVMAGVPLPVMSARFHNGLGKSCA